MRNKTIKDIEEELDEESFSYFEYAEDSLKAHLETTKEILRYRNKNG